MKQILLTIEVILGALLALLILLQHRASGLSAAFGGGGTTYVQRRGAEKVLFRVTVWIAVVFFVIATALMYIK
jgi:protein translocase SecG subunit